MQVRKKTAFTLIEVLVVIAIIAILADLEKVGFVNRGGKGSHRNFTHAKGLRVTLSGGPGDDARHYQERDVRRALDAVKES